MDYLDKVYTLTEYNKQFKCINRRYIGGIGSNAIKMVGGGSDYRYSPSNSAGFIENINGEKIYITK